jgi:hypothetical protein
MHHVGSRAQTRHHPQVATTPSVHGEVLRSAVRREVHGVLRWQLQ